MNLNVIYPKEVYYNITYRIGKNALIWTKRYRKKLDLDRYCGLATELSAHEKAELNVLALNYIEAREKLSLTTKPSALGGVNLFIRRPELKTAQSTMAAKIIRRYTYINGLRYLYLWLLDVQKTITVHQEYTNYQI